MLTDEQMVRRLALIGAHLADDDWQLYLYLVETMQEAGLAQSTILTSAEAWCATKGEFSCLS